MFGLDEGWRWLVVVQIRCKTPVVRDRVLRRIRGVLKNMSDVTFEVKKGVTV